MPLKCKSKMLIKIEMQKNCYKTIMYSLIIEVNEGK